MEWLAGAVKWKEMTFKVKFWGVRGSIPCSSPSYVIYGGNTSCVEVMAGEQHIILDAGTGLRALGHEMLGRTGRSSSILLSHTHWDHISGFPFFVPFFQSDYSFQIYSGHSHGYGGIRRVLSTQMSSPLFPVPLSVLEAQLEFIDFHPGQDLQFGDRVVVKTASLNHPDGATGYRVEFEGFSVCYVTDTEHVPGQMNDVILDLISGADLVIYDSTYTDDEFSSRVGWGHSTWQEGVRLCQAAEVKRYALFHHDPERDDDAMVRIEKEAASAWPSTVAARDGMEIIFSE